MKRSEQTIEKSTVLITGASSGFGKAAASLLAKNGYRVLGASRQGDKQETKDYELLSLDVRSDESVRRCVDAVLARTGRLDVLINNAGYELAGALEETTVAEAKAQFETNFFGIVRMTNAVLPVMRKQREGRVINVSSLAGLVAVPFHGIYSASKYAVEGYTEALRQEVKRFNILVSLIEPGFFSTNLARSAQRSANSIIDYADMRRRAETVFRESVQRARGPEVVAAVILSVVNSRSPLLRYRIGTEAVWLPRVKAMMTQKGFENGVRKTFQLDG
ncbi:MAG: SDR family NAD(P)-dependent oxidoreductase [Nitrospirota bacterium]